MANVLKKIKAKERREKSRFQQRAIMALIGLLFFAAIFVGCLWIYTSTVESERRGLTEQGINALTYSNFTDAAHLLEQAAQKGEPYAYEFLAWMYASGGHYEDATRVALRAASMQRPVGYEVLGDLALLGYGPAQGTAAAISYFEQGALKQARREALQRAGESERDIVDILSEFERNPDDPSDPTAYRNPDVQKRALELFTDMVSRALPLAPDADSFSELIMKAYNKGAKNLELEMGDMLFIGGDKAAANAQVAVEHWQRAMDAGVERAYVRLAGAYWHGYSVMRDPQNAIDLYTVAASNNQDPVAMYALALINLRSILNPDDVARNNALNQAGIEYLTQAAAQGYGPASTALGVMALTENSDPLAAKRAAQWLRIAAVEQNDISGRILYDLLLITGTGVAQSFTEGFDDLILVAEAYPPAQGILDLLQKRIPPEVVLRQAMALSNQVLLGHLAYREGDPVAKQTLTDPVTGEVIARPFSFYQSLTKVPEDLRLQFGLFNFTPPSDFTYMSISGEHILSPDLAKIIIQYAPSTGAAPYEPYQMMPRPLPPQVPPTYAIGSFVPPISLLEPQPLLERGTGINRSLF